VSFTPAIGVDVEGHPSETGKGVVGNKKVTSVRDQWYQQLDWEAGISCRWQQVQLKYSFN